MAPASVTAITTDTGASAVDGITNDNTLVLSGTAEANASVEVFLNAVSLGTVTANGAGAWSFDHTWTTLADAAYVVTAQATDTAGNVGALSADVNVTVDTAGPAASVTAITTDTGVSAVNGITSDATLVLSGTAEANASVEVFLDAVSLGTVTANGAGTWSFDHTGTTLADASYVVTAQATDTAGNVGALSAGFNVTVDTTGPAASVTAITTDTGVSGADGITSDNTLMLSGTAEANASVEVFLDAVSLGTVTANGAGAWSFDHTGTTLADATYVVTAQATDTAGNVGALSAGFNAMVDTGVPVPPSGDRDYDGHGCVGGRWHHQRHHPGVERHRGGERVGGSVPRCGESRHGDGERSGHLELRSHGYDVGRCRLCGDGAGDRYRG